MRKTVPMLTMVEGRVDCAGRRHSSSGLQEGSGLAGDPLGWKRDRNRMMPGRESTTFLYSSLPGCPWSQPDNLTRLNCAFAPCARCFGKIGLFTPPSPPWSLVFGLPLLLLFTLNTCPWLQHRAIKRHKQSVIPIDQPGSACLCCELTGPSPLPTLIFETDRVSATAFAHPSTLAPSSARPPVCPSVNHNPCK